MSKISYHGYDYRDDLTRSLMARYEASHPNRQVRAELVPLREYRPFAEDLFKRGVALDAVYLGEEELGAWTRAGWLTPLDEFAGHDQLVGDMFPYCRQAMTAQGKSYGVPAYAGFQVFVYNEALLRQAGIEQPPATWKEVREQARALQKAKLSEYPLTLSFGPHHLLFFDFWAMVFASGGRFFDEEWQPLFPDRDETAVHVLEWLVHAIHDWKILDPASIEQWHDQARDKFANGEAAFTSVMQYVLKKLNTPAESSVAGQARAALYPGLARQGQGTLGWTRMYGLANSSIDPSAVWDFLYYFGGKDEAGHYYTAEQMHLETDVGFAYDSLWAEPSVRAFSSQWCDVELYHAQQKLARSREAIQAPWWSQWEPQHQEWVRRALRREISPREALASSAQVASALARSTQ